MDSDRKAFTRNFGLISSLVRQWGSAEHKAAWDSIRSIVPARAPAPADAERLVAESAKFAYTHRRRRKTREETPQFEIDLVAHCEALTDYIRKSAAPKLQCSDPSRPGSYDPVSADTPTPYSKTEG